MAGSLVQVQVQDVGLRFGSGPLVLREVTLAVAAGEVLAVHGANGAGKTTLLRLVAGVLAPSTGRVQRCGSVGYLPQLGAEPPPRLAVEAWRRFAAPSRDPSQPMGLLVALDGPPFGARLDQLSGGSLAKVLLTAALTPGHGIVVLDEPFAALDVGSRFIVTGLVRTAAQAGAALLVSDHTGAVDRFATHVAELVDGRLQTRAVVGLDASRTGSAPRWRLQVVTSTGDVRHHVVAEHDRDRVLLKVLTAGGQVLHVEQLP